MLIFLIFVDCGCHKNSKCGVLQELLGYHRIRHHAGTIRLTVDHLPKCKSQRHHLVITLFEFQAVPSLVCPAIKVNEVIHLKPEQLELPAVNSDNPREMVVITPPCAHTGPGPVKVRLMSYEPREGQVRWFYQLN